MYFFRMENITVITLDIIPKDVLKIIFGYLDFIDLYTLNKFSNKAMHECLKTIPINWRLEFMILLRDKQLRWKYPERITRLEQSYCKNIVLGICNLYQQTYKYEWLLSKLWEFRSHEKFAYLFDPETKLNLHIQPSQRWYGIDLNNERISALIVKDKIDIYKKFYVCYWKTKEYKQASKYHDKYLCCYQDSIESHDLWRNLMDMEINCMMLGIY
jgi:hypothetical protein